MRNGQEQDISCEYGRCEECKMYGNHATQSGVGLLSQSRGLKPSAPMNQTGSMDGDCKPMESKGECRLEGNLYHTEY